METTVTLVCHYCGKQFDRRLAEHTRTIKKERHAFCGYGCSAIWGNKEGLTNPTGNPENLIADNRKDEYTPFRYFRRVARGRKQHKYDLDLSYLKTLWEEQNGRCPLTGWKLRLPPGTKGFQGIQPDNASLDRIDSNLGYIKGNVRYIAVMANLARNTWDDDMLRIFAHAIIICEAESKK